MTYSIDNTTTTVAKAFELSNPKSKIVLADQAIQKIQDCHQFLVKQLSDPNNVFYGINTGFGNMCDIAIAPDALNELQSNLIISHACGMGDEVPPELVRLMLFLKIKSLAYGYSGVRLAVVERLQDLLNENVLPVIYQQGSLGASGDLAPLSHMALGLLAKGEVDYKQVRMKTETAYQKLHWTPLNLEAKEGLALINGTQFMSAYGVWCVSKAIQIWKASNLIAAISLEAYNGRIEPFKEELHLIRNHPGQIAAAASIRAYLKGSELMQQEKTQVQDPYSFRCVPQVHGASWDTICFVEQVLEREINGVTDNPILFPEDGAIVSGGNFHGQPLALSLDYLSIALAELGNISERRTYKLLDERNGLPVNLTQHAGLHSGMMIPQYTAASIVSQNKQLCTPASVDSITSSKGQEDHVSMGANSATKCYKVVENVERILAIELLLAFQALDFQKKNHQNQWKSSPIIEKLHQQYREDIPFLDEDRYLREDMMKSLAFLRKEIVKTS